MFSDKKLVVFVLILVGALAVGGVLWRMDNISSVKGWVVSVATATGEFVSEKAEFLHTAIVNTFFRIKMRDGVEFDRGNPLEGQCVVDRFMEFKSEQHGLKVEVNLKNKKMRRNDEMSPWVVDYDALPPEVKRHCEVFNPANLPAT